MRNEFVHFQFPLQVVVDKIGELCASLDASEGAAFPHAAGDELEGCSKGCQPYFQQLEDTFMGKYSRLVLISCPAAATPMMILWPQPL